MSAAERASRLNALAVARLNEAVASAQLAGEPDLRSITDDLMNGKRPAELHSGREKATIAGWIILIVLMFAASASKAIVDFLGPFGKFLVILPMLMTGIWIVGSIAGWMKSAVDSTTMFTYGARPGPKCEVSGCSTSASYSLSPPEYRQINLCYDHRNNLENRMRYAGLFRAETAKSIVRAYQDLTLAAKLSPGTPVIEQNLKQARELAQIVLERKLEL